MRIAVAGGGLAGLAAALRAVELGAQVTLLEKGDRLGGSFVYSSGCIWSYKDLKTFRREAPNGDAALQTPILERLETGLDQDAQSTGQPQSHTPSVSSRPLVVEHHAGGEVERQGVASLSPLPCVSSPPTPRSVSDRGTRRCSTHSSADRPLPGSPGSATSSSTTAGGTRIRCNSGNCPA